MSTIAPHSTLPTPSPSGPFVHRVITNLPPRQSMLARIGQLCLTIILSPLWLWSCFALLVVLFHRPLLVMLSGLTASPTLNLMIGIGATITTITLCTHQMLHDLHLLAH